MFSYNIVSGQLALLLLINDNKSYNRSAVLLLFRLLKEILFAPMQQSLHVFPIQKSIVNSMRERCLSVLLSHVTRQLKSPF